MSVIGSNIIAGASGTVETGYQISRSLRFNSADSAYLNRTPGSAGNRRTWTVAGWCKKSALSTGTLFSARNGTSGDSFFAMRFESADTLNIFDYSGTAYNWQLQTTQVFRDLGAWMHIVLAVDTTQATASNRVKLYINGVQVTAFSSSSYPSQNYDCYVNNAFAHSFGASNRTSIQEYLNHYLADVRFIDGQALTPSDFGETDSATGVWVPKAYTGTYGTNGFWLKFDDNSGTTSTTLGKDSSGNGNNWTPNNFSVTAGAGNDSLVDSPTNYGTDTGAGGEVRGNYATWNPLAKDDGTTLTNGNLDLSSTNYGNNTATFFLTSGKWYWEGQGTGYVGAICGNSGINWSTSISNAGSNAIGWWEGGPVYWDGGNNGGSTTFTSTDVVGVALDMDAGVVYFYKNGTLTYTITFGSGTVPNLSAGVFPCFNNGISSGTTKSVSTNFGQRPFAYTAPSGFKALCTQNLPTPAIGATSTTQADDYFNAVAYSGNSSTQTITTGFQPDLVWIKSRSTADIHSLQDVLRGARYYLISNSTAAEATQPDSDGVSSFTSTGFSLGYTDSDAWNKTGNTYISWAWKANGAGVSNTAGSITSTVSANQTAGISVVTWTNPASGSWTVGHGLGVAPKMIITKGRSGTNAWVTYHEALGNTKAVLLNTTAAADTNSAYWNNTSPTSSVFSMGSAGVIGASYTMVAYCFAEVAGFSKFGSYTGNGSTDGPFVYCGFRPRFVFVKRTDTTGDWVIHDTARSSYNQANAVLYPNLSNAEDTSFNQIDILSNGFKCRSTNTNTNASGGTYIFAAFGEAPFNYSRAR